MSRLRSFTRSLTGCVVLLVAAGLASSQSLVAQNATPPGPSGKPAVRREQPGKPAPEPNRVGEFMKAKLQHAQRVLEGLATEDFDLIAKHSQEMSLLSQAATWQVLQTPKIGRAHV